MFKHSVKVPRHFKVVANIIKQVATEGGSVKTLLYDNKLRHFKTNVLYALITETIKHAAYIDKIFEHCQLLQTESRLDPWLAKVLTTELLFGRKSLPGKSKPEKTILSYKEQFEKYVSEHQDSLKNEAVPRPRYVRINTNLLTTSDAIRAFQNEGYHFIRCTSGPYDEYLEQIKKLTEFDFTQDYHIKTIFVFAPGTKWHDHKLYLEDKIVLQDKATAMAVHLLAPPPGSVCLDMCAAPGMKTTQLAAYLRNEGKIFAVERDAKRYQTLCEFVEKTGSTCVETAHKDALEIKRGDHDEVEYILLDPSCSGSGMDFCVHNYIEESRLAKLTSLQEKFLKHAMNAFPKAKRIIYSTCSVYPEENERVVTNVVKTSRTKWRVRDVKELLKGQWNNFGSGMYGSMGTRCMYAKPETDFTTGFFLAVLDRNEKDLTKANKQENSVSKRKQGGINLSDERQDVKRGKSNGTDLKCENRMDVEATNNDDGMEIEAPRKKKKKRGKTEASLDGNIEPEELPKKKKHKQNTENLDEMEIDAPRKKKKKCGQTEASLDDNIEPEELRKKKKRKQNTESLEVNVEQKQVLKNKTNKRKLKDACDNLVDLRIEDLTLEEVPEKKKKKDKVRKQNDNVETTVNVETIEKSENVSIDITAEKKSHKKKKYKDSKQLSEIVISELKIRKKKSKVTDTC